MKHAAPSTSEISRPGRVAARTLTFQITAPITSVRMVIAATISTVEPRRPAMYAQRGRGVPCMRFRTPSSRRIEVEIAMFTKVVVITP